MLRKKQCKIFESYIHHRIDIDMNIKKRKQMDYKKMSKKYVPFGFDMKLKYPALKWKFDNHK